MQKLFPSPTLVLGIALAVGTPLAAWEYQCRQTNGCHAEIYREDIGRRESFTFRRGELVDTEDGWIVDPENGWVLMDGEVDQADAQGT